MSEENTSASIPWVKMSFRLKVMNTSQKNFVQHLLTFDCLYFFGNVASGFKGN